MGGGWKRRKSSIFTEITLFTGKSQEGAVRFKAASGTILTVAYYHQSLVGLDFHRIVQEVVVSARQDYSINSTFQIFGIHSVKNTHYNAM